MPQRSGEPKRARRRIVRRRRSGLLRTSVTTTKDASKGERIVDRDDVYTMK